MFSSPPPGNETPGASRPEPTAGSLLLQPMLLASLLGASVESAVLLVDAGGAGALASVAALGLWLLLGLALTLGLHGALWLALGKGGAERLASGCRRGLGRWWLERGLEPDRERLARALAGALVGLGWLLSSWLGARHLIEHRHGAGLIAAAALGLQLASIPLYLIAFGALRRALRWAFLPLPRWISLPSLGLGALGLGALASLTLLVLRWEWMRQAGIPALALPLLALALGLSLALFEAVPRARSSHGLLALLAALGLIGAGLLPQDARIVLGRSGISTPYLQAWLRAGADFDGDGMAAEPFGNDCAPFDPSIHPMAREIDGNGIDENCDGLDRVEALFPSPLPEEGASRDPDAPVPDLVLITFDSLRADHMGFLGYDRPTTPRLDALASGGVIFERVYSQDSGTGPSFWSMMAGKTPFQVALERAERFPPVIGEGERLLAETLAAGGYRTMAKLCGDVFSAPHWNLRRGFATYQELCGRRPHPLAPLMSAHVRRELPALERSEPPFFLWVHFMDTHHPYSDHLDQELGPEPMDHYDEEIAFTERHVAELAEALLGLERERPMYVFIAADHGENFHEHGVDPHARTLYREVTHVPLLVLGDELRPRREPSPIALNDLYPTMLHLAGLAIPEGCTMRSFVPQLLGSEGDPRRVIFQENSYSRPRRHVKAVLRGWHHLIRDLSRDTFELYDLRSDPGEQENLVGRGLPEEAELVELMGRFVPTTHVPPEIR